MPNQIIQQVQFPPNSSRLALSPGYELIVQENKIYGIYIYRETRICSIDSNEFNAMLKDYMPFWAAYFGDNFKDFIVKGSKIDFNNDPIAVTGLKYILEAENCFEIPSIGYEIRSWINETLNALNKPNNP